MNQEEIKQTFDNMAPNYDAQYLKTAPVYNLIHYLLGAVFSGLKKDARVLCVGAGTGSELVYLAEKFPAFLFTAVEPSGAMLEKCREKVTKHGFTDRITFHEGYAESLLSDEKYDAATSILVSHFILEKNERIAYFKSIAERMKKGAIFANCDLSADVTKESFEILLRDWVHIAGDGDASDESMEKMKKTFDENVSMLPNDKVAEIIEKAGFKKPVQFFQAGLICGWHAERQY